MQNAWKAVKALEENNAGCEWSTHAVGVNDEIVIFTLVEKDIPPPDEWSMQIWIYHARFLVWKIHLAYLGPPYAQNKRRNLRNATSERGAPQSGAAIRGVHGTEYIWHVHYGETIWVYTISLKNTIRGKWSDVGNIT